ncbi:MAG: hypothetical protein ACUVX9_02655 [Anaerolineae bacterium]
MRLSQYYGPRVVVQFVDIFSPQMLDYPEALHLLNRENIPLPLVSVDGEPKFAGGISLEMISEEIEKLGVAPASGSQGG